MSKLEELRKELDSIDDDIARLLHRRASLVLEVRKAKAEENIDIYSPTREREILDRVAALVADGQFPRPAIEKIFQSIIGASRSLIGKLSISYLGPESSLSHQAAVQQFGDGLVFRPEASLEDVFAKVESGDAHYGLVPVRTSAGVTEYRTLELLTRSKSFIIAELEVTDRLGLLGEGPGFSDLQQIYSDALGFERALKWIRNSVSSAHLELVENSDRALKMAQGDRFAAAVSLEANAERYGLKVLASGIDAGTLEPARFLVVGPKVPVATGKDKSTVVCMSKERPGILRDILQPFSDRGITLVKIESRKLKEAELDYAFYLDVAGHQSEAGLSDAVTSLSRICSFVRVLGSYPHVCQS